MAHRQTRSSPSVWLVGKPVKDILGSGLPTNGAVLRNFLFHHQKTQLRVNESAEITIEATLDIWEKARIPTQRKDNCVRKLTKLFDQYRSLRKRRLRKREGDELQLMLFKSDLDELFDVSQKDALAVMTNDEDKQFLQMQKQDPSSSSMSGIDQCLANRENRRRARGEQEAT